MELVFVPALILCFLSTYVYVEETITYHYSWTLQDAIDDDETTRYFDELSQMDPVAYGMHVSGYWAKIEKFLAQYED